MEEIIKNWNSRGIEFFTEEELKIIEDQQNDIQKDINKESTIHAA